jgi:pyruvate dehydrogenase E1 component alpha subunit/2-oxoisovalerate dehydrogenase E1 component alpha subunit
VRPTAVLPHREPHRVLDPSGSVVGPLPDLDLEAVGRMYRTMALVRHLDARMLNLQRQGRVGFYGTCTGQEAAPVAAAEAAAPDEWIFPALREGAAMLHRGYPLTPYLCQVFGHVGDPARGRQMPSHQASAEVRFVSWSSCIGTQLPQAVGAARVAARAGRAVLAFLGDGATSTGDFHVALHAAGTEGVPCVFVCQNNHWSISVPARAQTGARTFAEKAHGYGLAHARVDGNDALAVHAALSEALERARSGAGGALIELLTYRMGAHSSSDDPRAYRSDTEVDVWRARDPLIRIEAFLRRRGWDDARFDVQADAIREEVDAAIREAENAGPFAPGELEEDVWSAG